MYEVAHQIDGFMPSIFFKENIYFFILALRPNAGHGLLILEVSRSHTTTYRSR
jgi:hypothetical protein